MKRATGFAAVLTAVMLLSLLPIFAYNGRKRSRSKALQWGFYLFYPVHILLLYLLKILLF